MLSKCLENPSSTNLLLPAPALSPASPPLRHSSLNGGQWTNVRDTPHPRPRLCCSSSLCSWLCSAPRPRSLCSSQQPLQMISLVRPRAFYSKQSMANLQKGGIRKTNPATLLYPGPLDSRDVPKKIALQPIISIRLSNLLPSPVELELV